MARRAGSRVPGGGFLGGSEPRRRGNGAFGGRERAWAPALGRADWRRTARRQRHGPPRAVRSSTDEVGAQVSGAPGCALGPRGRSPLRRPPVGARAPDPGRLRRLQRDSVLDPVRLEWSLDREGDSCSAQGADPCTPREGGVPGAVFIDCGCKDSTPPTPICCHIALEGNTGVPLGNGSCFGDIPLAGDCPAFGHCDAAWLPGSSTRKRAECKGAPPPEPPPGR